MKEVYSAAQAEEGEENHEEQRHKDYDDHRKRS